MPTQESARRLIVVEEVFQIAGRHTIVVPDTPFDTFGPQIRTPYVCSVLIKRPDGSTLVAEAHFSIVHLNPLATQLHYLEHGGYACMLRDIAKSEVPIGSEIYEMQDS